MINIAFFTYLFLFFIALVFSFFQKKKGYHYVIIYLFLFFWSLVARNYALQIDMIVYASTMTFDKEIFYSFYYIREPVYWLSSKLLYDFIGNEVIVFIMIDCLIFLLLVYTAYKKNISPYFILLFMLFFANLMGFLNVYRQFLATVILFVTVILSLDSYYKSRILYVISFFTHNVAGLFLPFFFIKKKFHQSIIFYLACILSLFLAIFSSNTKSIAETGETSPVLFLIVVFLLNFVFIAINKFIVYREYVYLYYINIYGLFLSTIATFLLSGAIAKRIAMIALVFLLYSLYVSIENYGNTYEKILLRIILVILAVLPTFLFSSALNMLLFQAN